MAKTLRDNFSDWEGSVIGFGYGTGEPHTIPALEKFMTMCPEAGCGTYDFREIEKELGAPTTWLLISILCRAQIIEYGTSPRFGWLTPEGVALKQFICATSQGDLIDLACRDSDYVHCYPDACNCGPNGYQAGVVCENPFWKRRT